MPSSSVSFNLPYAMTVQVQAFVNAGDQERVTITPWSGPPIVWSGTGYYDQLLGQTSLTTPASGTDPAGVSVSVAIEHSTDGGRTWAPSQVDTAPCQIMYLNLQIVASEDSTDDTWDDCTVYFSWTQVPTSQSTKADVALKAQAPAVHHSRA